MTKPVTGLNTYAGVAPPWSLSQLDADFAALQAAINDLGTYANPLTDTSGTPNVITVNSVGGLTAAYGFGLLLYIKIANTNTSTAVTINLNSLGNVNVVLPIGSGAPVGAIVAGGVYAFIHDGSNFQTVTAAFASLLASNNTWTGTNAFDQNVIVNAPSAGAALAVTGLAGAIAATVSSANTSTAAGPILESLVTSSGNNQVNAISASNGTDSDLNIIITQIGAASKSVTLSPSVNLALQIGGFGANTTAGIKGFGPVAGAYVDMTTDRSSFAIAASGFASGGTGTAQWARKGQQVTLFVPLLSGISNSTGFSFALPAAIQPSFQQFLSVPAGLSSDNGSTITDCSLSVNGATAQFFHNFSAAGWTATGVKASGVFSVTYLTS